MRADGSLSTSNHCVILFKSTHYRTSPLFSKKIYSTILKRTRTETHQIFNFHIHSFQIFLKKNIQVTFSETNSALYSIHNSSLEMVSPLLSPNIVHCAIASLSIFPPIHLIGCYYLPCAVQVNVAPLKKIRIHLETIASGKEIIEN